MRDARAARGVFWCPVRLMLHANYLTGQRARACFESGDEDEFDGIVKTGLFISTLLEITSGVTRKNVYNYICIT